MKEKYEFPAFTISWVEDGIVQTEFKKISAVTVEDVNQVEASLEKLAGGKRVKSLTILPSFFPINRDAMRRSAQKQFQKQILASAIVMKSAGQRIAMQFYLSFHKNSNQPKKLFGSREKAIAWLKKVKIEAEENAFSLA